jgi:cell division protein FtsI (penicillin-binding protein 3)
VAEKIYAAHTRLDVRKLEADSLAIPLPASKAGEGKVREGLVPRVTGMGAKDAVYLLESCGLQVTLSGMGSVVSQSIPPGQRLTGGQSITITLR